MTAEEVEQQMECSNVEIKSFSAVSSLMRETCQLSLLE